MTNQYLTNPYLRSMLAHELLGIRKLNRRARHCIDAGERRSEAYDLMGRMQTHLTRHGAALLAGDPTPLRDYPASFAGH